MIDEALGHSFVFITAGINHELNYGDTIVCIGPKDKLNTFEDRDKKGGESSMKLAVIGAGKWGQALYHAYSKNNDVVIYSRTPKEIENFVSLDEALDREYLIMAIPAQFVRGWMENNFEDRGQNIVVAAKGIETSTGAFLNDIYSEFLPEERLAYISGPSFAAEVKQSLPTALMISSTKP